MYYFMKKIYSLIIICLILSSCGVPQKKSTKRTVLRGDGSSFVLPMSSVLFREFGKQANMIVDYTPDTSYFGINSISAGTVDFALSEVFMTDKQLFNQAEILHIPVAVAGINFAYNIKKPGFSIQDDPLYLTPDIIAKIYLGKITKWNDPEIVAINKQVAQDKNRIMPNLDITIIRREQESGDTYLLSQFLTKASPTWKKETAGIMNKFTWDIGIAQKSSLDVVRSLVQTEGSFAYTTMIYGLQNNIPLARIKNFLGTYVRGCNFRSLEAMKIADTNADNRVDLTYPTNSTVGREAAVATAFIYMLVRKEQNYNNRTKEQAQATVDLINWLLSPTAQRQLDPIFFAPLTPKFRNAAQKTLIKMTYDNTLLTPTPIKK